VASVAIDVVEDPRDGDRRAVERRRADVEIGGRGEPGVGADRVRVSPVLVFLVTALAVLVVGLSIALAVVLRTR